MKKELARALGFVVVFSAGATILWAACDAGTLPCESDPEWKAICDKKRPADAVNAARADGGTD